MYTPEESAWIALAGLKSHYGVKPNKVLRKDFLSNLNVPKVPPKWVKLGLIFMAISSYSILKVPLCSPLVYTTFEITLTE